MMPVAMPVASADGVVYLQQAAEQREECCGCIEIKCGMKVLGFFYILSAVCLVLDIPLFLITAQYLDSLITTYMSIMFLIYTPMLYVAYIFY